MNIIEKYNVSVPRYTSYPPANYFHEMDGETFTKAIDASNNFGSPTLSFYFHIPFCRRLCLYCGCNSYLAPSSDKEIKQYIDALHKEIDIVAFHLDRKRKISQIHYGGGSPTILSLTIINELNNHLLSLFPTIEKPEIAIECHPGYLSLEDWDNLAHSHFNRFSIGVQDFNEEVLKTVGRKPSAHPVEDIMKILHSTRATVNMDFLYGLPGQTPESFAKSIRRAIKMRPDRLVTFSYGHVPWVFKRQASLEAYGLPSSDTKQAMYDTAATLLQDAGYTSIGLDHFVLPTDELNIALKNGQLHRNFQGYCTRRTTGQVYAFGVTGISQLDTTYAQNTKDIDEYIRLTNEGKLSTKKGYSLNPQERITKEVVERLMCNYSIRWKELSESLKKEVSVIQANIHYDEPKLKEMMEDGIINISKDGINITDLGHPFVRNVAAELDPLMQNTTKKFSKPI